MLVDIDWTCNFDYPIDDCIPTFTFERVDNDGDGIVSEGFNFRTVVYENNSTIRELKKLYGIRITFTSSGRGGIFSFVALTITLGAGIAYLGVSKLITDLVLSNFMQHTPKYLEAKYLRVHQKSLLGTETNDDDKAANELANYIAESKQKTQTNGTPPNSSNGVEDTADTQEEHP